MQDFHMPDSYYDQPDDSYTPAQEKAIEDGLWDDEAQTWEEFQAEINYVEPEFM